MNESINAEALQVIQQLYGENASFREGQYEAIEATLTHRRTLVVQKTGWGKSLVYFVCTKLQRNAGKGMTIVVSPLLVLMENQMQVAQQLGLQCAVLNSSTKDQREEHLAAMVNGDLDLVLITPETLFTEKVQTALQQVQIGLFVIDEAHCISDWGHDFRLEYTRLNKIIRQMPHTVPILGTTATANNRVIADLKEQFGEDVFISRGELMRHSLSIQILHLSTTAERYAWILENVPQLSGSGIIYCLTQRDCEHLAGFLQENGISALAYHSGMEQNDTENAESLLRNDQIKVLVATVKLGMGYDKGNIAFVIHYQQPSNIVAYYQQIGRAGRNIDRAYTFLMCGEEDRNIQNYFIETAFPSETEAHNVYDIIYSYAESGISRNGIQSQINIRANRLEKALMFLRNEEFIVKEGTKYYPTLHRFQYNSKHYDAVTQIRRQEQHHMSELSNTTQCLSRFIVNRLDDPTTENCGICRNCLGYPEFPEYPSQPFVEYALDYIERLQIPIEPRKKWPDKSFTGISRIPVLNEVGLCLSKYGDPGYGTLVKNGKYGNPAEFCEELIGKSASVLRPVIAEKGITAITCVPSLRSKIVENFAVSLAERCKIPFVPMLKKHGRVQQKDMENSVYQCRNAWNSFSLLDDIEDIPTRIILVDEINRIKQLLGRGGSLSFALEQYENMGISVVTRADALYPKSLKLRLGKSCPPLFYYAGNLQLAGKKAIGFVGARGADDHDRQFTESTVSTVNSLGFAVVSGGARGVDTMASSAAIRNGSAAISYLADSLIKQIRNRENISAIQNNQLLFLSAVKPDMGFTAGTAMMRNRYIYAQSDGTVVVRSDYKKGGTWNGAVDCIKHEICPVLCWNKSEYRGNQELIRMGAVPIDTDWNGDLSALPVKEEDPIQLTLFD